MTNFKLSADTSWQICLVVCLSVAIIFIPDFSIASTTDDGISTVLCTIVQKLTGATGKTIAMIAMFVLGTNIFIGKIEWPSALATALGITFIFSAGKIVNWLAGQSISGC